MIDHPIGVIIFVGSVIIFHGSVYALVALNTGWRFGYWLTGAAMGGLAVFLSIFWVVTALGPRGPEPHWVPIAAESETISQAKVDDRTLTELSSYPSGSWMTKKKKDPDNDAFKSAIGTCLTTEPEDLEGEQRELCEHAQTLIAQEDSLPKVEGARVAPLQEVDNIRFQEEDGTMVAQGTVTTVTRDPRLTGDRLGKKRIPLSDPFVIAAYRDPGSVRLPPLKYLIGSVLFFAIHLLGLSRAERRRLSPVAA
ncbi:MAG TPA: hypothetical protein VNE62_07935 [Actinomycetota bacterium]|nr:hypothetical protein [Actinomycetota bacterium]